MKNLRKNETKMHGQSSLELLITLSFGLIILLPIVALAMIQISSSSSNLTASQAQAAASKLASVAVSVGSQGYPARQLVLIQVPPNVQNILVGTLTNGVGHEVIFVVAAPGGSSYITAYTPINMSGYLEQDASPGVYLVNVSAQTTCPSNNGFPCVYIQGT